MHASASPAGHSSAISWLQLGPACAAAETQTCTIVWPLRQPSTPLAHSSAISSEHGVLPPDETCAMSGDPLLALDVGLDTGVFGLLAQARRTRENRTEASLVTGVILVVDGRMDGRFPKDAVTSKT